MRPALVGALVFPSLAVLDCFAAASTVVAAPAQHGIERFQLLSVQAADWQLAQQRPDVLVQLLDVPLPGRRLDVEHLEPAVEQLVDGRSGPRVAALVDLGQEAGPCLSASRRALGPAGMVSVR